DINLNLQRIKSMHLPISRIFVPWEAWNPSCDYQTFTWESDEMLSLYNILDVYQRMKTKVILVTVDWMKESPWRNPEGSSQAVVRLLEYLIKDRGFSCIEFWTLTNEPELTYEWLKKLPFEYYIQIHRLVKQKLKERELPVKIIVADEVESWEWFERSVHSLCDVADVFSSHAYFFPRERDLISDYFDKRLNLIKKVCGNREDILFILGEFGFRGIDFGVRTNSFMEDYEYGLYVADLCIKALNSGVDSASLWCLHQIRLIDEIYQEGDKMMRIGLWAYKDRNWHPFPIFYLYRLFSRYIKSGSIVTAVKILPSNILNSACVKYNNSYSLFILNMTKRERYFQIEGINSDVYFRKYIYSKRDHVIGQKDWTEPEEPIKFKKYLFKKYLKDRIPPMSVILYSSLAE
ncbi:MAG: hypothetical protein NC826_04960, partial [Candidatus Omnitrophica bacterium]|nr:hypothetical protein [Candidatus Omnitrophota bacterium]